MFRKQVILSCVIASVLLLGGLLQLSRSLQWNPFPADSSYAETEFPLGSSDPAPGGEGSPLRLLIYSDPSDAEGLRVKGNLAEALELAKLAWDEIAAEDIAALPPDPWQVLVLTGQKNEAIDPVLLKRYVENGGRLAVMTRFYAPALNELFGMAQNRGFLQGAVQGITMVKPLFPGYPDLPSTNNMFSNSMLDVTLLPASRVYLTAGGVPLLWTHGYGSGRVVYWNSTTGVQKTGRGLLVHSLGLAAESMVTAQAGIRTLEIDDFPSPAPQATNPLVRQEYGLSTLEFYERIWWADMARFAGKYGWKYTGLMIGNYQNRTTPPLPPLTGEGPSQTIRFFGPRLLKLGGELGLHGYNHQSLVTPDEPLPPSLNYVPWPDRGAMAEGLTRLAELAHSYFPDHDLRTYVPPSNVMGREGKEAIAAAVPSVNIIASLYFAGSEEAGPLEQEFGPDPDNARFYDYPRISSGYWLDEEEQFFQTDAIANFGLVNHFVHPDDVLDAERSQGRGWSFLSSKFEEWMAHLTGSYPYLQPLTVRDSVKKLILYQNSRIETRYTADRITIRAQEAPLPSVYTLRLPAGKQPELPAEQGTVISWEPASGLWRIEAAQPALEITLKDGEDAP
ncbi:hypothetical protein J2T17_000941 [Paenibacillus mucilaginosus]|uniref:DUF2194 domain-containing protein n=1 Tax=Paenibacillus mucilaginosus TaxID=61624 RepID=UPI003D2218D1